MITPRVKYRELPDNCVSRLERIPPVQDSAVDMVLSFFIRDSCINLAIFCMVILIL